MTTNATAIMDGKRFLFMDDDQDDRDFFQMVMEKIDPSVTCVFARDGAEGLALMQAEDVSIPNAIFIDLNMPLVGGKECLTELKKMSKLDQVPIYIYSTTAPQELVDEMLGAGAREFLVKPSSMSALEVMLRRVVS